MDENPEFLTQQLITYIGNKRTLLPFIGQAVAIVKKDLNKSKISCADVFSGSGIVARYLKQFSSRLVVNDLENYSCLINRCYLSNFASMPKTKQEELKQLHASILQKIDRRMKKLEAARKNGTYTVPGFISELYAPQNIEKIQREERCFYTPYNANYIDVARQVIDQNVEPQFRDFFIAPLLSQASVHANTAGIFKGFYKNSKTKTGQFGGNGRDALKRILGEITIPFPVFSNFSCPFTVFNSNVNDLIMLSEFKKLGTFDMVYLDPPYNQHPYGSNYFMLNLITDYKRPDSELLSKVSGIPNNWNRSNYNKKLKAADSFFELIEAINSKYVLISFNSEGFISKDQMISNLSKLGKVNVLETEYNTFKGSRNLNNREIYVKEYLFLVKKN